MSDEHVSISSSLALIFVELVKESTGPTRSSLACANSIDNDACRANSATAAKYKERKRERERVSEGAGERGRDDYRHKTTVLARSHS